MRPGSAFALAAGEWRGRWARQAPRTGWVAPASVLAHTARSRSVVALLSSHKNVFTKFRLGPADSYSPVTRFICIAGRPLELIENDILRHKAFEPVILLGRDKYSELDIRVRVKGGGHVSQTYAIRQALAKALVAFYQKCAPSAITCACACAREIMRAGGHMLAVGSCLALSLRKRYCVGGWSSAA